MPTSVPASDAPSPTTLRDLLRVIPRLDPERTAALLGGTGRALAAWHTRPPAAAGAPGAVAYGALAPERILVGPHDLVRLAPAPRADGGPTPGPRYLAPEQIDGRPGDPRSDIYALGLVGWEMLAGQQPWEGESLYGLVVKQREQDLPRLSTLRPGLPRALVHAIDGCLHKAPSDRWQTVDEFLAALGPAGMGSEPSRAAESRAPTGRSSPVDLEAVGPRATPHPPVDRMADPARRPTPARALTKAPADGSRRGRWLAGAVLGIALLGAGAAAVVVVRGRGDARETRAWLDSVTARTPTGDLPNASPAQTTTVSTTSARVRRTGAATRARPADEAPDTAGAVEAPAEPPPEPALEPTPPLVAHPGAPLRPTVPRPTVPRLPVPDTGTGPDSLVIR